MKNKNIFFPGLGENPNDYASLSPFTLIANIDWNIPTYKPSIKDADTLASFSLGAIFPLQYSQKNKIRRLILCSPTPFENLGNAKFYEIIFIVGSKEKFLIQNIKRILKKVKVKKSLIIVKGADHKIEGKYRDVLIKILKN